MDNYNLSYANILNDRKLFRNVNRKPLDSQNEYNLDEIMASLDQPGHKYFKIFFHFNNGSFDGLDNIECNSGLLAPSWYHEKLIELRDSNDDGYDFETYNVLRLCNSAWSYLKLNGEDERASNLIKFVELLSKISCNSPWYFSEILNFENVIKRRLVGDKDGSHVMEERPQITIKCMQDSVDDRIGTLLDLYRSIVWSWTTKREIVPANLRKFDMSILVFESPIMSLNKSVDSDNYSKLYYNKNEKDKYVSSYKYYELHNCEIDYNSSAEGEVNTFNNAEGITKTHNINIFFDDCYESRFNEFHPDLGEVGDYILNDLEYSTLDGSENNGDKITKQKIELKNRLNAFKIIDHQDRLNNDDIISTKHSKKGSNGISLGKSLVNAAKSVIHNYADPLVSKLKRAFLGNLYTFSLPSAAATIGKFANGNVYGGINDAKKYIKGAKSNKQIGNISNPLNISSEGDLGTIMDSTDHQHTTHVKRIGSIYKSNTLVNNI